MRTFHSNGRKDLRLRVRAAGPQVSFVVQEDVTCGTRSILRSQVGCLSKFDVHTKLHSRSASIMHLNLCGSDALAETVPYQGQLVSG